MSQPVKHWTWIVGPGEIANAKLRYVTDQTWAGQRIMEFLQYSDASGNRYATLRLFRGDTVTLVEKVDDSANW